VWAQMVERTLADPYALGQVLYKATALMLTGLSVSLAFEAGLFNIGGEAQLGAGVFACATVGAALPESTPAIVAVPVCMLAAAAAGAATGYSIGFLRVTRNAHEILTSIMINAIVAGVVLWLGNALIFEGGTTRGGRIVSGAELPALGFGGSNANASLFIAVAVVGLVWWLRSRTTWGVAWRAIGRDPAAAKHVGIDVGRGHVRVMLACGAIAGLAGTNFVLGHKHAFEEGLGRGVGILGISAAFLGRGHPAGVAVAAIVLGFLSQGGLAVSDLVPKELTEMLQGIVVLAVAASGPWVRRHSKELAA
jgi:general nucleoside transport system permease protein